jgi:hypothetical protein
MISEICNFIKEKLYLILPLICLSFWALLALAKDNFTIAGACDYKNFYYAGRYLFTNPDILYNQDYLYYHYLPSFALIFIPLSIIDYLISEWIFFFIILFFGGVSLYYFDKILLLYDIENKFNRFLILIVLSNGIRFMQGFDCLQPKQIVLFLFLLFLEREIRTRKFNPEKLNSLKFQFFQSMILIFTVGMIPYFAFLIFIYLFERVKLKEVFSKTQLQRYGVFILSFILQNFMFLIFPTLISGFLGGLFYIRGAEESIILTPQYIVQNEIKFSDIFLTRLVLALGLNINDVLIVLISISFISILTLYLIINKSLSLEKKFGYFALSSLFIFTHLRPNALVIVLPFIMFLVMRKIKLTKNVFQFTKNNLNFLIEIFCILLLYLIPPLFFLYRELSFLKIIPPQLLLFLNPAIYTILSISLLLPKIRGYFFD